MLKIKKDEHERYESCVEFSNEVPYIYFYTFRSM